MKTKQRARKNMTTHYTNQDFAKDKKKQSEMTIHKHKL